jgi:hypothetical protein
LLAAVWLGGVVLATGTGLLAVRLVAAQVGEDAVPVLSADDVGHALASESASPRAVVPAASTSPAKSARPTTSSRPVSSTAPTRASSPAPRRTAAASAAPVRSFSSDGGSVGARCRGAVPEQVYATPAQGYRLDQSSVQGDILEVRFESSSTKVRLEIGCRSGTPYLADRRTDTSGSGDSGGSGKG